jgi:hypothetical protein
MEDTVKELEKKWAEVQENALKQPSPGIISSVLYLYFLVYEGPLSLKMGHVTPSLMVVQVSNCSLQHIALKCKQYNDIYFVSFTILVFQFLNLGFSMLLK